MSDKGAWTEAKPTKARGDVRIGSARIDKKKVAALQKALKKRYKVDISDDDLNDALGKAKTVGDVSAAIEKKYKLKAADEMDDIIGQFVL